MSDEKSEADKDHERSQASTRKIEELRQQARDEAQAAAERKR